MKRPALGSNLFHVVIAERVITILTRVLTDVPMLAILAWDSSLKGLMIAFLVVTPISLILCINVVLASDVAQKRGLDLTGLETLRELEHETLTKGQWVKRFIRWMLMSKRLIFWIGSWFYLDPDYVTLLLRKKGEGYVSTFLRITLPSVVLGMVVWLGVYWAAVQGYRWASWALEWAI